MPNSILTCPHCKGQIPTKVIPLRPGPTVATEPTNATFESTAPIFDTPQAPKPSTIKRNFWASDGVVYSLAGLFACLTILIFAWAYGLQLGAVAAAAALAVSIGLHVLKIYLNRTPPTPRIHTESKSVSIRVETWDKQNKQVLFADLDERITVDELRRVAVAVLDGVSFARGPLCKTAKISQNKYRLIKAEFERLNYAATKPNNQTVLSFSGRKFLRQCASLP